MKLWFVEIFARNPSALEAWYSTFFERMPDLRDAKTGFVLYQLAEGRVAVRSGHSNPGGVLVHVLCEDLDAESARLQKVGIVPVEEVKTSDAEKYRRRVYEDPEGNRWSLFEWVGAKQGASEPL